MTTLLHEQLAYPCGASQVAKGFTKRERWALAILQGFLANSAIINPKRIMSELDVLPETCFVMADLMMKEAAKPVSTVKTEP